MRVFIALEIPEDLKARIFHEAEILENSKLASGNFVDKENLHLTLKFLGERTGEEIEKIKEKLSEIEMKKSESEIGKIGFFPNEISPKVLWISVDDEGEISKLQKNIDDKLAELEIVREKEFLNHLTLARIKLIQNKEMFLKKVQSLKIKKEKFSVDGFSLIKSELTKTGPKYKLIKKFNFTQ